MRRRVALSVERRSWKTAVITADRGVPHTASGAVIRGGSGQRRRRLDGLRLEAIGPVEADLDRRGVALERGALEARAARRFEQDDADPGAERGRVLHRAVAAALFEGLHAGVEMALRDVDG